MNNDVSTFIFDIAIQATIFHFILFIRQLAKMIMNVLLFSLSQLTLEINTVQSRIRCKIKALR